MNSHIFHVVCGKCSAHVRCFSHAKSLMGFDADVAQHRNALAEKGWLFTAKEDICPECAHKSAEGVKP
jgi:hypothetical protein